MDGAGGSLYLGIVFPVSTVPGDPSANEEVGGPAPVCSSAGVVLVLDTKGKSFDRAGIVTSA